MTAADAMRERRQEAKSALDAARQSQLGAALAQLLGRWNVAGSDSLVVPGEYLEIVITKA